MGLATAESDTDWLGVYVTDGANLLGLDVGRAVDTTVVGTDPDIAVHEIGKFTRLALKGNPTVTELLWVEQYQTLTEDGSDLVAARHAMLSEPAVRSSWLGYARAQGERARRRHRDGKTGLDAGGQRRVAKAARHAYRLVIQASELLTAGTLTVNIGDRRDEIEHASQLAVDDLGRFVDTLTERIDQVQRSSSVLPAQPDRRTVERTIERIRRRSLERAGGRTGKLQVP